MRLSYAGLEIEDLTVLAYEKQAVYDGPDYLYTRHKVHVRGVFNPQSTSYRLPSVPGSPVAEKGQLAGQTDIAIRHRLLQPRQPLYFWVDQGDASPRVYVLVSPQPKNPINPLGPLFTTDANNGPLPVSCNVSAVSGTKTFLVDFIIQTDINECNLATGQPPIILSHRWAMEDEIDFQFLTTRHIKGRIILATDRMLEAKKSPDSFRNILIHPVGRHMNRMSVVVRANEDNNSAEYEIVDREVIFNLGAGAVQKGVVKIEGTHTAITHNSVTAEGTVGNLIGGFDTTAFALGRQGGKGTVGAAAPSIIVNVLKSAVDWLPRTSHQVQVAVWGRRSATRSELEAVARQILFNRVTRGQVLASAYQLGAKHYLHDERVDAFINFTTGPVSSLFLTAFGGSGSGIFGSGSHSWVKADEEIPSVLTKNDTIPPNLIRDGNSREGFLQQLISASLHAPCQNIDQAKPPSPPSV